MNQNVSVTGPKKSAGLFAAGAAVTVSSTVLWGFALSYRQAETAGAVFLLAVAASIAGLVLTVLAVYRALTIIDCLADRGGEAVDSCRVDGDATV